MIPHLLILLLNKEFLCLLYTSDAADDTPCVDLGGRRIINKTKFLTNKLSEEAFNQLLLQIAGKKLLASINMINSDAKFKIEKCIAVTNEEYSYALSLQADCVPDSKRMIIQAQKRLESLNSLLTLAKLI